MKSKKCLFKITALFICVILLLPMILSCGDKSANDNNSDNNKDKGGGIAETAADNSQTPAEPEITAPPETDPPPTTEPPPTDPPTTWEPIDPNLPYWEQIKAEMARYGLGDGVPIMNGADESEVMRKFNPINCKKAELDITGDKVPFSSAYRVTVAKDTPSYGSVEYKAVLVKGVPVKQGDLVVGVFWIKGARLSETEQFMSDDEPQYYLAVKSSTDSSATEGDVTPNGGQYAGSEWQKVFFYGKVINEESNSNNLDFRFFLGYGNQQIDVGGAYAYWFPYSAETEKAAIKLVDSVQ